MLEGEEYLGELLQVPAGNDGVTAVPERDQRPESSQCDFGEETGEKQVPSAG